MAVNISPFISDAQKIEKETGIPASIILGQIMLESSGRYENGLSGLAIRAKNLFGIKGAGSAGTHYVPTTEYKNGKAYTINAGFRKYNSYYESMLDHAKLLSKPRYAVKLKNAKTIEEFARGIKAGGYATDPNYVNKLLGVISKNNLHQYDQGDIKFIGASDGTQVDNQPSKLTEKLFFHTVKLILLITLFILMVIFFLQAFPKVETPVKKVLKNAI